MWRRVWTNLSDDGRARLLDDLVGLDRTGTGGVLVDAIARRLNFRRSTILKCSKGDFRRHVSKVAGGLSERVAARVLRDIHLGSRRAMMDAVHAHMGWPPIDRPDDRDEDDVADPWMVVPEVACDALREASATVGRSDEDAWLLIVATLAAEGHPKVLAAATAIRDEELARRERDASRSASESELVPHRSDGGTPSPQGFGPSQSATGARAQSEDSRAIVAFPGSADPISDGMARVDPPHDASGAVSSKSIDRSVGSEAETHLDIRAFLPKVSALIGVSGDSPMRVGVESAFGPVDRLVTDRLVALLLRSSDDGDAVLEGVDLVRAFVALNPTRHASLFHQGFFSAIAGLEFEPDGPGWNMERRLWYAHGWALGLERARGADAALAEFERWRSEGQPFLERIRSGTTVEEPRSLMGEHLTRLAIRFDRGDLVEVAIGMGGRPSPEGLDRLLGWLLQSRHARSAEHRLSAARAVLKTVTRFKDALPPEVAWVAAGALVRTMREAGRFEEELPRRPATTNVDPAAREVFEAETLLHRLRIGSLETLSSRTIGQWRDLAMRLEAHRDRLARPWRRHSGAVISLIAALQTLYTDGAWKSKHRRFEADRLLTSVIEAWGLSENGTPEHRLLELATWWRQGLRGADPDAENADETLLVFEGESEIGGWLPSAIHAECILNAGLVGRSVAKARLVEAYVATHGVEALLHSSLLDSGPLPASVIERIRLDLDDLDRRGTIAFDVQWSLADAVLHTALDPVGADHAAAEWAFDQLERLGATADDRMQARWLDFLQQDDRSVRCFESEDELDRALLIALDRAKHFDAAAQHVLDRLEAAWQRGDRSTIDDLIGWLDERHRGDSVRPEMREPPHASASSSRSEGRAGCSVLFIGGNESQARYQSELQAIFAKSDPNLSTTFELLGWSSNWGREIDRLKTMIRQADAVVLMSFMRTQCGRTLRRTIGEAGKAWIPCTGHGRASIEMAIRRAAEVARAK